MKNIYLDHAATTPLSEKAFEAMKPYFTDVFGNANSQHAFGRDGAKAVADARQTIAECIGAKPSEIYFTSCGTEADNWAIKGVASQLKDKGKHIVTSAIEHPAIYTTCKQLEKYGYEVTYLPVDGDGFVSPKDLEEAIREDTVLVSIMYANNEIGTIQPIKELCEVAHRHGVLFHTDAVQATGAIRYNVKELGVDMLSMSAHKFYGPKGMGALYVRNGMRIEKLLAGGEQERAHRGGTTNTPGAVGMAVALKDALDNLDETAKYVGSLRDRFVAKVIEKIDDIYYNGAKDTAKRLYNNANFSFRYIEGESILFSLDLAGICASSGSACSSGSLEPSRTLLSIGVPVGTAHGSIRFTFGKDNTVEDVDYTVGELVKTVEKLRAMSPLYKKK
ncbi:MAG: cysteine desulfurase [Bacteroides sp.]|nr:cysteine desulfurase [Bacillota bacterium]MCM1393893.1 cysteine desulfurase [[Eubacterium] siraeum]MCM1455329.1 cysteine desulfurase [Bacteroides sp.]